MLTRSRRRPDGGRCRYGVHVGHWEELDGLVEAAYSAFGRVDVLVNNAGMSPLYDSVDAVTEDLFDKVIAVNLKGPFRLAALVGTRMAAGAGGSIINITSAAAVRPRPDVLPYAAAKAGLNALTAGLARTLRPDRALQRDHGRDVPDRCQQVVGSRSFFRTGPWLRAAARRRNRGRS